MQKVATKQHRNIYGTDIIIDIITETIGLAIKKNQLDVEYVKDKWKVKGLSMCIFKSKANDYHPKIIADKQYSVPPTQEYP